MTKIIHVHLLFERKDYYFGSLSAIYSMLDYNIIGIKKNTLLHKGLIDGSSIVTKRAIIRQSHLIRNTKEEIA